MTGLVVLSDVRFPDEVIAAGLGGQLIRENERGKNQGGFATVNIIRDATLREWQVSSVPMSVAQFAQLESVFEISDAGAYGVLLRDPKDSKVTVANGALLGYTLGVESGTVGFGNGCPTYGFRKLYISGSRAKARIITRPYSAALYRGGSPVTIGASAGNASISAGPSYVTFVADATRTVSSVTVGAATQVTLSSAIAGFAVGGRLWLQGLTGADAALLNNQSHQITAIAGAVYTLATSTAGKTITVGSGQGHKYPQPTDALTWAGIFDMPVQFRDDSLPWSAMAAGDADDEMLVVCAGVYLDEVREQ